MPAQAGIQLLFRGKLDPSFRWGDERREDETFSIKKVSSQKRRRADRGFREQDMKKLDFEGLLKALSETKAFARGRKVKGLKVHVPRDADR